MVHGFLWGRAMEQSEMSWSRAAPDVQLCRDMRLVLASLVVSSIAGADPRIGSAVRVGYSWMSTDIDTTGAYPRGNGPCGDGEVTWRYEHVSVGVFGALYTLRANTDADNQSARVRTAARYELFDLGGRVSYHTVGDPA